jgi:hypothetical protein
VTVRLPRPLDRWLRIEAAKRELSRSHLIRAILQQAARSQALTGVEAMQPGPDGDGQIQEDQEESHSG